MVDRLEVLGHDDMVPSVYGDYVLHSDYADLLESHARLLEACKLFTSAMRTTGMYNGAIAAAEDAARTAIAAAQPFTEK